MSEDQGDGFIRWPLIKWVAVFATPTFLLTYGITLYGNLVGGEDFNPVITDFEDLEKILMLTGAGALAGFLGWLFGNGRITN